MPTPFNITPQAVLSDLSTIGNLVTNVLKTDIVAVLDQQSGKQIFGDARPIKAFVKEMSLVMDYPVETGATLSDHKIILPTEIEWSCILRSDIYSTAFQEIRNAWINSTLLAVQTRMGTYRNMVIADRPHEESADEFNIVRQFIRFREVQLFTPASIAASSSLANYSPADPQNAMTVNRGLLSGVAATGSALSYFNAAKVWGL